MPCVPPAGPEMGGGGRGPGGQQGMMGGRGRGRGPPQYLPQQGMMGPPSHPVYSGGPPPQQSPPAEPTGLQVRQGWCCHLGKALWELQIVGVGLDSSKQVFTASIVSAAPGCVTLSLGVWRDAERPTRKDVRLLCSRSTRIACALCGRNTRHVYVSHLADASLPGSSDHNRV